MAVFQTQAVENNYEQYGFNSTIGQELKNELTDIYKTRENDYARVKEEQNADFKNIVSVDKFEQWQNQGKMTALETWNKKKKYELLPYIGTIEQGKEAFKLKGISDKLRRGEVISAEEKKQMEEFVLDMAEIQTRGMTFGAKAVDFVSETLPFVAEFGLGLLTSGGVGSLGATSAKVAQKGAIKAIKEGVKDSIGKTIAKGVGKVVYDATINPRTWAFNFSRLPQQIYARMGEIELADSMYVTPEGQIILNESTTNPAMAFLKALALTNIEVGSEMAGVTLFDPIKRKLSGVIAPRILEKLPSKFSSKLVETVEKTTNLPFLKAVDSLGFNGVIEEMGEERVGDILKFAFNLDDKEGYSFEQLLDAVFVSPEQLALETISFGAFGVGANLANTGLQKVSEKYSKDEFLIDAGIFRIGGSLDKLDAKIKELLAQEGKTEEEISDVLQFASRDDKVQYLKNKEIDTIEVATEEEKKYSAFASKMRDRLFNQLIEQGIDKNLADSIALTYGARARTFLEQGNSEEEIEKVLAVEFTRDKVEELLSKPVSVSNVNVGSDLVKDSSNLSLSNKAIVADILETILKTDGNELSIDKIKKNANSFVQKTHNEISNLESHRRSEKERINNEINRAKALYSVVIEHEESSKKRGKHNRRNIQRKKDFEVKYGDYQIALNEINALVDEKKYGGFDEIVNAYIGIKEAELNNINKKLDNTISQKKYLINNAYSAYRGLRNKLALIPIDKKETKKNNYKTNKDNFKKELIDKLIKEYSAENLKYVRFQPSGISDAENANIYYQTGIPGIDNSEKYQQLPNDLKEAIDYIFNGESVYNVTGEEFPNNGENVNNRVNQFYKEKFDNKIINSVIGVIKLDKRSIKDSIYHGTNKDKINAFAAVPYVLQKGKLANIKENYKNKEETRFLFVAPITLRGEEYFCEVVVKSNKDRQGFYLHEIELKKKLVDVFSTSQQGTSTSSKSIIADLVNKLNPNIKEHEEKNLYFQPAYHGTRIRGLENTGFDLSYALSGEGAMAHGWGVYTAKDKDVADENYRDRLSNYEIYINDKKSDNVEHQVLYHIIKEQGAEKTRADIKKIIELENEIQKLDKEIENAYSDNIDEAFIKIDKISGKQKELRAKIEEISKDLAKIKDFSGAVDFVEQYEKGNIKLAKGQLYEVDIPEDDVLLDEDEPFSVQPEKVQTAIRKMVADLLNVDTSSNSSIDEVIKELGEEKKIEKAILKDLRYDDTIGKDLYRHLSSLLGSKKEASLKLNKYGVEGITYYGEEDGRCYVIFDEKAVKILNTFYQEQEEQEDERLLAGFKVKEIGAKLEELYEKLGDMPQGVSDEEVYKMQAKINALTDGLDYMYQSNQTEKDLLDIAEKVFYVMNDEELPHDFVEADKKSSRTIREYADIHKEKKAKREDEYAGYYTKENNKNFIGIAQSADVSTIPHELAHLYLEAMNVLARGNAKTREELDEVNNWLGSDGTGYTVEQHEKFAKTYEAYLANGKAPSNTLREVFENFKEWLKASFRNALYEGMTITPEAQKVFDRMFGQGDYTKKQQKIKELLEKVREKKKAKKIEIKDATEKNLTEYQKRYKESAYNILSIATEKDKRYLKSILESDSKNEATAKKRETILKAIDEVEDRITLQGIDPSWAEFFAFQEGKDYEIAMNAYNAIINKEYLNADVVAQYEDDWATEIRNSIDEADYQYKKIVVAYKNNSKDVALATFYEWLDGINPEIQNDYKERFLNDVRQIDRIENQKDIERAKERILKRALEIENKIGINTNEGYIEFVKSAIGNLTFLSAQDKARLAVNILDVSSMDMLMGRIDGILDIAQTMQEVEYRRKLEQDIRKELMSTKNVKKGARTVGKYDYRTNKIFEELRRLNKLSKDEIDKLGYDMQKMAKAEDEGISPTQKLFNKFIKFKADGRTYADTALMKDIYDEITKIKLIGKTAKDEKELLEKLDNFEEIKRLTNILKDKKKGGFAIRQYLGKMGNLESFFTGMFNKEVKEEYATEILYAETLAETWRYEQKKKFESEVAKIYNLPDWDWDRQILKYLAEKYTFDEYRRKYNDNFELVQTMTISKEMTKMDVILAYMWSHNDVLKQRLINMFGETQLDEMQEILNPADIKFANLMMRTAQSFYPIVNKAFIQKYGLDLPRVNAYFPSKVERSTEVDMFNDYSAKSLGNSFTKERTQANTIAMDFSNPVQILYSHIDGVAKFAFMSESLDKVNLIFKNPEFIKPLIENIYGDDVYKTFQQALLNVTYKSEAPIYNGFAKVFDNLSSNWIQANISMKPLVALKQLISANNYAVDMPALEWSKGFIESVLDFKNTIDFMWSIPYVRARFGGNYSNEFLRQTIENSAFARSKKLKDFMALNVKLGDLGSLVFGGKPYIDYLIKKGASKEEAIKQFVLATNRMQQSSAVSSLSNFQVWASRQPLAKVMTAYRNSQQQYARKCGDAIVEYANGDITLKQCAKTIFHFMFLQPFIFALAGSGSLLIWANGGDDDEFWSDVTLSLTNLCSDSMPFFYDIYSYALRRIALKEKYVPVNTPLWGDIIKEIERISKKDADWEDYIRGWGYLLGNVASGVPVPTMANTIGGIRDMFSDNYLKGLFRLIGYSERRAGRMAGKEEDNKKKRNK